MATPFQGKNESVQPRAGGYTEEEARLEEENAEEGLGRFKTSRRRLRGFRGRLGRFHSASRLQGRQRKEQRAGILRQPLGWRRGSRGHQAAIAPGVLNAWAGLGAFVARARRRSLGRRALPAGAHSGERMAQQDNQECSGDDLWASVHAITLDASFYQHASKKANDGPGFYPMPFDCARRNAPNVVGCTFRSGHGSR